MGLTDKVTELETGAAAGLRLASFWRKQINEHGEDKATAFYKSLGLNHLETKAIEWEGLSLSRQPTEAEKLCVKGIAGAQEAGKASVTAILLDLRTNLITEAMKVIKKLTPADYHTLILEAPEKSRDKLRDELVAIFKKGRRLVVTELSKRKADPIDGEDEDEDPDLDDLVDVTDSRVANDVQSRITAAATRFALLGLTGAALWEAVRGELNAGSVSYIDRAATGLSNKVIALGRYREMQERDDDIERYEYSALLDPNTCPSCSQDDGLEASTPDDLPTTPNPECDGSDFCRCFIVAISL